MKTGALVSLGLSLGTTFFLQGCGESGTPAPTPAPPTPTPAPGTPTPAPSAAPTHAPTPGPSPAPPKPGPSQFCTDAACCKSTSQVPGNMELKMCDDFYDPTTGIAVTMLSMDVWNRKGGGPADMDNAVFLDAPPKKYDQRLNQAVSISHNGKGSWFYPASKYGLIYSIAPGNAVWEYATVNSRDTTQLCAQCTDGWACSPDFRAMVDMPWEEFLRKKDDIVRQTGTAECKNPQPQAYNEFDVNGLPGKAIAGILSVAKGGAASRAPAPTDDAACRLLEEADPQRTDPVPIYEYRAKHDGSSSSLAITRFLSCPHDNSAEVALV
eukprot:TRINITY_DN36315_c0_g1_i1.p1 TRINITY_DN36315_c0_g1~~TRINITY_DN36315_c0_g1_i1.p1  ORF type:complete len:324 (+),score=51.75 TRINITY_DN36315_c0_g1_i1:271-1242(+)